MNIPVAFDPHIRLRLVDPLPGQKLRRNRVACSEGSVLANPRHLDKQWHRFKCEHLSLRGLQHAAHIFAPDLEAPPGDAGNDIVVPSAFVPERTQALDTSNLVPGRTIILRQFGLDEGCGIEFVRDNKIRGLVKARDALCASRLSETDACARQGTLDSTFYNQANQLTHSVTVRGEGSAEKTFVKQYSVWNAEQRYVLDTGDTVAGINLVKPMDKTIGRVSNACRERFNARADHSSHALITQASTPGAPRCQRV